MKKFMIISVMIAALSIMCDAAGDNGTWSKPFDERVYFSIEDAKGAGNYIWFRTENGVGRFNTITMQSRFFSYSSMGCVTTYPRYDFYGFAAADSDKVVLYYTIGQAVVLFYDGITWKETISPCSVTTVRADTQGNIWGNSSSKIVKYNGVEWQLLLDRTKSVIFPEVSYMVDDTGLWVGAEDSITDSIRIYRFDGSTLSPIVTIKGAGMGDDVSYIRIFKDSKGVIWIVFRDDVYTLNADRSLTKIPQTAPFAWNTWTEDSDGNYWIVKYDTWDEYRLDKYDVASGTTLPAAKVGPGSSEVACNNGVYVYTRGSIDLKYFADNGFVYSVISTNSWSDACGNLSDDIRTPPFFRKDGSIIAIAGGYLTDNMFEYKNGKCREMPGINQQSYRLLELSDGTLLAYGNSGIYTLHESTWDVLPGTENFICYRMLVDRTDKLWGIVEGSSGNTRIVHQTDAGWELIDSGNANLHSYLWTEGSSYIPPLLESADGSIWAQFDRAIGTTRDGYHWTFYDSSNSNLPNNYFSRMFIDGNGNAGVLCMAHCTNPKGNYHYGDTCLTIISAVYNGSNWTLDTITPPVPMTSPVTFYRDGKGDLWIFDLRIVDSTLSAAHAAYRSTGSSWIRYDSSNIPYSLIGVIGEDVAGKIYFRDKYGETVVFDCGNIGVARIGKFSTVKPVLLHCAVSGKNILVNYTLSQPGEAAVSLYSLQGRLVKVLTSGYHKQETYHRLFTVNCASGIYLVRLVTPVQIQTSQIIMQ